ncbi:hypothetical protein [Mesorhizobium quangtriensis]|uniref:hypothetical protein n=1 Tax=Mesorhizobium quangtriensis TaxID=3157709 RepID=UPI003CCCF9F3
MRGRRCAVTALSLTLAALANGCGTPREKTAPCKRPANLSSYVATESECGPMMSVNTNRAAALEAVQDLAAKGDEWDEE